MASEKSLGVHVPVALPYLIAEGLLPKDPRPDQYTWETYARRGGPADAQEELLSTRTAVAWSQGNFVRNVYRFDLEAEDVTQAILTTFPAAQDLPDIEALRGNGVHQPSRPSGLQKHSTKPHVPDADTTPELSPPNALVVVLKTKAHVFFLRGAKHIVDLPFEIRRVFPAPRGIVLQRKRKSEPNSPPTPHLPSAPPNSFFPSQLRSSASHLQSPTLARSITQRQPRRPSFLDGDPVYDPLLQDVPGSPGQNGEDNATTVYTLTDPLSDLGVVTYSLQQYQPRLNSKAHPGLKVEFEGLDPAEEVVYISPGDELSSSQSVKGGSLFLLVTLNRDSATVTLWHAWYLEQKTLQSLLKQRKDHKASKLRRRSSFLSTNLGTGAATPAIRHRDAARESFAPGIGLPGETNLLRSTAVSSRKPTRLEEEAAMTSQMDPDYMPAGSQQPARESRRISSLNADVRASHNSINPGFGGHTGRRVTSFGGERRSLGLRKSRGSTPGSVLSRALGPEDDSMDLDSSTDFDTDEIVEDAVRYVRATLEAAGLESVLNNAQDEFKRDLVVRKIHSFSVSSTSSSQNLAPETCKVITLPESRVPGMSSLQRLNIYYHQTHSRDTRCIQLHVRHRRLWPNSSDSPLIAIPLIASDTPMHVCDDIVRFQDGDVDAILFCGQGLLFSLDDPLCPLPFKSPYRVYNPLEPSLVRHSISQDVGKNRVLEPPSHPLVLGHPSANGNFDEIAEDGTHHRRKLVYRPRNVATALLFDVCETVLPQAERHSFRRIWCQAAAWLHRHPEHMQGTSSDADFIALTAAIFTFALGLLDDKTRAALDIARLAGGRPKLAISQNVKVAKSGRDDSLTDKVAWSWTRAARPNPSRLSFRSEDRRKDQLLIIAASLAIDLAPSSSSSVQQEEHRNLASHCATMLMFGLHVFREEKKLCTLSEKHPTLPNTAPIIAQLGLWLGFKEWAFAGESYYAYEGADEEKWAHTKSSDYPQMRMTIMERPVGIYEWFEHSITNGIPENYPSLAAIVRMGHEHGIAQALQAFAEKLTPRITMLFNILASTDCLTVRPALIVEMMAQNSLTSDVLDTLPESIAAPLREAITRCEKEPPTSWSKHLLQIVGRDDLALDTVAEKLLPHSSHLLPSLGPHVPLPSMNRDTLEIALMYAATAVENRTKVASRHAVSRLIFHEDRAYVDALTLTGFTQPQFAECPKQPEWDDTTHWEAQRKMMQWVTLRMIALPAGNAMIFYDSQEPLLTEKFPLPGFSSSCIMLPMSHTLTADRSGLTEEKVNWAYFHAGVSTGLGISRQAKGIDTSWIAFNKPAELTNRHAGLLLALGLGGHLRNVAKWLSFKYLTPKHTMTSVGLLLGLSASNLGTMDSLVTRMLSVHITRMLPPGAAELNVSPATQTTGLMGIGLLFYNTQHRRMSEIMLSEIELLEVEDPDNGPELLRDESYRLAAGFALGLINVGRGGHLRGLNGMRLPERLLAMAVGPRPVHAVHVFDRATAGAVIALALVYMKSGDRAIANKVDIPDTEAQFDQVRPDILMLRAMAKHIILWAEIEATEAGPDSRGWILDNLPACYKDRAQHVMDQMLRKRAIDSAHIPLFNVFTGLAWALGLRYAGSGNKIARDDILDQLRFFYRLSDGSDAYYFDGKLGKASLRRCMDVLALCAAMVMAGTGDLVTFRYLRRMHGRIDPDTTYGSHLAAHLAIGALFMGGGTHSFGTSNLAIAALIAAFYPLFPEDVHDNRVHLQAFRHLWVLAAEARCIVVEDIDTQRPIHMPIKLTLKNGKVQVLRSPCLLPDFDTIATIQTDDPSYWRITLDFAVNPAHLAAFRADQRVFVRRCPAAEAHTSVFAIAIAALNETQSARATSQIWHSIFSLTVFKDLSKADMELILPPDVHSSVCLSARGSVVDDRLVWSQAAESCHRDALWNLRVLFAWAEKARSHGNGRLRWLGHEVVEGLRAKVEQRARVIHARLE